MKKTMLGILVAMVVVTGLSADLKEDFKKCMFEKPYEKYSEHFDYTKCGDIIQEYVKKEEASKPESSYHSKRGDYLTLLVHTDGDTAINMFKDVTKNKSNKFFVKEAGIYLTDLYEKTVKWYQEGEDRLNLSVFSETNDMLAKRVASGIRKNLLNDLVNAGRLPTSFTINLKDVKTKTSQMQYNIDTFGLLNKYINLLTSDGTIDSFINKNMIINSFFMSKGLYRTDLYTYGFAFDLENFYKLSLKNDKETMKFLNLMINDRYDDALKVLLRDKNTAKIYTEIAGKKKIVAQIKKLYNKHKSSNNIHNVIK